MDIEELNSTENTEFMQDPFLPNTRDSSFKTRIMEYVNSSIIESSNQLRVEDTENESVSKCFFSVINAFKNHCERILEETPIPDSNETLLNNQQYISGECDYLSRKLSILQELRDDYNSELEAWKQNLEFFKNPLSLSCVEMSDCVFENINDMETLKAIDRNSSEIASSLQSIHDLKEEVVESREALVKAYQQYTLKRWNALECSIQTDDISVMPSRQSIM